VFLTRYFIVSEFVSAAAGFAGFPSASRWPFTMCWFLPEMNERYPLLVRAGFLEMVSLQPRKYGFWGSIEWLINVGRGLHRSIETISPK
jgi:hypothetical protein